MINISNNYTQAKGEDHTNGSIEAEQSVETATMNGERLCTMANREEKQCRL